jgi:hypothetical protein
VLVSNTQACRKEREIRWRIRGRWGGAARNTAAKSNLTGKFHLAKVQVRGRQLSGSHQARLVWCSTAGLDGSTLNQATFARSPTEIVWLLCSALSQIGCAFAVHAQGIWPDWCTASNSPSQSDQVVAEKDGFGAFLATCVRASLLGWKVTAFNEQ